jgi:ABC-type phosphate transport system substrate-binding protein
MRTGSKTSRWVLAFSLLLGPSTVGAAEEAFKIVVHEANAVSSLTTIDASLYFLKKKGTWPGGQVVLPVDQAIESPVRQGFSKAVMDKDPAAVRSYWQTLILAGRAVPPPVKPSDEAVLAFVAENPGAIGYVAAGAPMIPGVKEVRLR